MSESIGENPYAYGTPEYDQYTKAATRAFGIGITAIPVGAATSLAPNLSHGMSLSSLIPGAATGLYSTADTVQQMVQRALGTPSAAIKSLPGGAEAGRMYEASHSLADNIPHMHADPNNEGEVAASNLGELTGAIATPIPGGLPKVLSYPLRVMLPGPRAVMPAVAISTALQGIADHQAQAQEPSTSTTTTPPPTTAAPPTVTTAPATNAPPSKGGFFDTPQSGKHDFTGVPNPLLGGMPNPTETGNTPPPPPASVQGKGFFDTPQSQGFFGTSQNKPQPPTDFFGNPTPTIAEQDKTEWTHGQTLLFGLGAVGAVWIGRKIMPHVLAVAKEKFLPTPVGQADLPGTTGSATTTLRANTVDATAPAKEFLKSTADTPVIGSQLQAKYGDITNSQSSIHRYQADAQAGRLQGQAMPALTEWQQDGAALTPAQKELFNKGMHAGNEIDNRQANFDKMKATGTLPTDEATRVNFHDRDLADLHSDLAAAHADPQVKALMDTAQIQTNAMADMMVTHGQLSVGEAQALKNAHKYYVPSSDMDNITTNPMNSRNIEPYSGSSKLPDVFELRDQHDYQLHKMIDDNNARDMLITAHDNWQAKTGGVNDKVFVPSKNPVTGDWVAKDDGSSLPVRRNGELQHWDVTNRSFLDAISKPKVQLGVGLNAMNKIRQLSQSSMTGAYAVATGHLFPVINAARSAGEISAMRRSGMYGSLGDKWVQKATGGRLALRGDPITPYLGTAYHMVADPAAEVTRALGEMFAPKAPNGINVRMRAMFGDTMADAISQRALAVYNLSNRAKMRAEGSIGSGGYTANEVTSGLMSNPRNAMMPSYDMVPELFQPNRWGGTRPFFVHMKNLFNDVKGAVGDAAHSNFDALNRDNPNITAEQRKYEVRNATGDPSLHGSGRVANFMSTKVPFGNVAMQEGARVARAFNEEPLGATLGYLTHYGSLAAASVFTAMMAGPDAVRHLFDSNTDAQRSDSVPFYIPGQPTNPIRLPVQINMRPGVSMMLQMMYDMYGLASHDDNPELAGHVMAMLADFFGKHVTQSTMNATVKGLSDATPPIVPAGLAGANTLFNNRSLEINPYNAYINANKPLSEKFTYPVSGANAHVPGHSGTVDPITGTATGEVLQQMLGDIFATFGKTILDVGNQTSLQKGSLSDIIHNLTQGWGMRARDSIPGANTLWNTPDAASAHTPLAQRVQASLDVMRPTASFKSDVSYVGQTRKGGPMLPVPQGQEKVPTDPTMMNMYMVTSKTMTWLTSGKGSPLTEVSDIRKQINSLRNSPLSPETVRVQKNALIEKEQDANIKVMAQIHTLNGTLSQIAGVPVDIQKVDFSKGPEQFIRK
jgi:hypothetical protein